MTQAWKPWWVTGGYAPSVQQALSARSGGGLAAAWARGVQAGSAGEPGELLEGLRHARPERADEHSGGVKAMTDEQLERGTMAPKSLHALIARLGERAKMPFPIHPHMLR